MNKTTTTFKMENNTGVDLYSLGFTSVFYLGGIVMDFQSAVVVLVGLSTLTYNVLRIYNDYVKKKKEQKGIN